MVVADSRWWWWLSIDFQKKSVGRYFANSGIKQQK